MEDMGLAAWVGLTVVVFAAVVGYFYVGRRYPITPTPAAVGGILVMGFFTVINLLDAQYVQAMFTGGVALLIILVTWYRQASHR